MKRKFERVYIPYGSWEETKFNMWGSSSNEKELLRDCILFTGDHRLYGSFMSRVIREWPNSCENALTDHSMNRKAWIGHAAAALAIRCPEHVTRRAWGFLTNEQCILANREAARAIGEWEESYAKNKRVHEEVGTQMLFPWDS